MTKKTALILSGGGAKGAFQAAAEKYAREVKGYHWDIIAGVSVGALNATMLSMEKYARLWEIWNTITNDQVFTGGFNLWSVIKLLFGARSFYGNGPLKKLLAGEFEASKITADLRVGAVSLVTGEYIQFHRDHPQLQEAVLASTIMPIIWEPLDISPDLQAMVDGGVRNITPIGDVLGDDPDEVVIINCGPETFNRLPQVPGDIVKIGLRTLDILLNETFRDDMREFQRINYLVQEARSQGIALHDGPGGRELKYFDCTIIEPLEELGDTLDFSQPSIQRSLKLGWERAKEVMGA